MNGMDLQCTTCKQFIPERTLSGTQQLVLRIHTRLGRAATTHYLSGSTKITRPRVQLASTMFAWCVDSNQPTEDNCSLTSQSILLRCKGVSTSMSFSLTALSPNSMTLSWDAWRYPLLSSRSTGWDNTTVAPKIAATSKLDAFTALMNSNQKKTAIGHTTRTAKLTSRTMQNWSFFSNMS